MSRPLVPAQTTAEKLLEYRDLATHLANRAYSKESHPRHWELRFHAVLAGILDFYLHNPGDGL